MSDTCKICNDDKKYSSLEKHLKMKHNITIEEYKSKIGEDIFDEVDETDITNPIKIRESIFDSPKEYTLEMSLGEYIIKKKLKDIKELNSVIDRYMSGSAIDVTHSIKVNQDTGNAGAEELKDQQHVETKNLYVAESLVKKYGFTVKVVKGEKPNKVWVLEKK